MGSRMHTLFDAKVKREPQSVFIREADAAWTFGQLGTLADVAERELRELGVCLGDRVLIVAENCPQHVALTMACSRVGAWSCGVNARMAPAEIDAFIAKADVRVSYFTCAVSAAAQAHAERLRARDSRVAGLSHTAPRLQATAAPEPLASNVGAIIFTSGTTGTPKGVMMTHEGVTHWGRISAQSRNLGPADRSFACLPMTHIFGLGTVLMASLNAGASLVMRSRFDPAQVLGALANDGVSQFQGPPALFSRLLAHMDESAVSLLSAPQLRYLYAGAAPLDLTLKRRVESRFGLPLHHGYGMSEIAGAVTVTRLNEQRDDTAAGFALDGYEYRIVNSTSGTDVLPGERGEIWVRGVGLTPGYFRDELATRAVMREGGWYASGDIGQQAADGALLVVDRMKEMIVRSGFNVYPAEVESAINSYEAVQRSAVVGQKQSDGNEEVVAFVELRPGHSLNRSALTAHLRNLLSPYKQPTLIEVVSAMPMTPNGKVLRRELLKTLETRDESRGKA